MENKEIIFVSVIAVLLVGAVVAVNLSNSITGEAKFSSAKIKSASSPECADIVEWQYQDYSGAGVLDWALVYVKDQQVYLPVSNVSYNFNKIAFGKQRLLFAAEGDAVDSNGQTYSVRVCEKSGSAYNYVGTQSFTAGSWDQLGDVIIKYVEYNSRTASASFLISGD